MMGIGKEGGERPPRLFNCSLCKFSSPYVYYGRNPKMAPRVVFLEDSFIANDPFSSEARPLCLGSKCAVCSSCVCVTCSIFYTKRLCSNCARDLRPYVPHEIAVAIDRLPVPPP